MYRESGMHSSGRGLRETALNIKGKAGNGPHAPAPYFTPPACGTVRICGVTRRVRVRPLSRGRNADPWDEGREAREEPAGFGREERQFRHWQEGQDMDWGEGRTEFGKIHVRSWRHSPALRAGRRAILHSVIKVSLPPFRRSTKKDLSRTEHRLVAATSRRGDSLRRHEHERQGGVEVQSSRMEALGVRVGERAAGSSMRMLIRWVPRESS
jgi:hypothetical protein